MVERQARAGAARAGRGTRRGGESAQARALWTRRALWGLIALWLARLALNAFTVIPVHFDEAQYWAYGRDLAFGYYSKPPLTAWLIRAATEWLGDTLFALRAFAPMTHLLIGGLIFLSARRLYDARTGFWAAAIYSLAPGVAISAHLMTTDPVMMAGWAAALYALIRVTERGGRCGLRWWALLGLGVGLGMMAKYTAVALAGGALGYALFSRAGRAIPAEGRRGAWVALAAGLLALAPNLVWNAANGFVTIGHLGENAELGRGAWVNPGALAEFLGAQFGVIGPVGFPALLAALLVPGEARDWRWRLLAWTAAPLLGVMCLQAFLSEANANWAAPAYVGGAILAARWLTTRSWGWAAVRGQAALGLGALAVVWGLGAVYAQWGTELPRFYDPFKKMRIGGPFCEIALTAMEGEGAQVLLSDDRRRLSECMFYGGMGFADTAVWDPDGVPSNHAEFRARLRPGETRPMVLAVMQAEKGRGIASHFASAIPLGTGEFSTHSDRSDGYALWLVEGFEGY